MIEFLDGPAAGVALRLMRAPVCLRAVCSPAGNWDALDQLTDTPRPRERVYVYVCVTDVARYCIRSSQRAVSGFYLAARYRHYPDAPSFADNAAWQRWCETNREILNAFRAKHVEQYLKGPTA